MESMRFVNQATMPPTPNNTVSGAEEFGRVPNPSETFGTVRNPSERFRTIPHDAEGFRTLRNVAERKESHTVTVREAARMFEAAGVARTERSIVNWCQPNRSGIARLDAYFDPNERRYYLTAQSIELAIAEEKAKAARGVEPSEPFGNVRNTAEELATPSHERPSPPQAPAPESPESAHRIKALEQEVMDLKITNKAKDYFIDQLKEEREVFAEERQTFVDKLITYTQKVGELETRLLQIGAPNASGATAPATARAELGESARMDSASTQPDGESESVNQNQF